MPTARSYFGLQIFLSSYEYACLNYNQFPKDIEENILSRCKYKTVNCFLLWFTQARKVDIITLFSTKPDAWYFLSNAIYNTCNYHYYSSSTSWKHYNFFFFFLFKNSCAWTQSSKMTIVLSWVEYPSFSERMFNMYTTLDGVQIFFFSTSCNLSIDAFKIHVRFSDIDFVNLIHNHSNHGYLKSDKPP